MLLYVIMWRVVKAWTLGISSECQNRFSVAMIPPSPKPGEYCIYRGFWTRRARSSSGRANWNISLSLSTGAPLTTIQARVHMKYPLSIKLLPVIIPEYDTLGKPDPRAARNWFTDLCHTRPQNTHRPTPTCSTIQLASTITCLSEK